MQNVRLGSIVVLSCLEQKVVLGSIIASACVTYFTWFYYRKVTTSTDHCALFSSTIVPSRDTMGGSVIKIMASFNRSAVRRPIEHCFFCSTKYHLYVGAIEGFIRSLFLPNSP